MSIMLPTPAKKRVQTMPYPDNEVITYNNNAAGLR